MGASPYDHSEPMSPGEVTSRLTTVSEMIQRLVQQHPVVVFAVSSCCMCLVVKQLFSRLGVNPTVFDIDTDAENGAETERSLAKLAGNNQPIPLVFIGGKLIGGLDSLMAAHISGMLLCQLREAKASSEKRAQN